MVFIPSSSKAKAEARLLGLKYYNGASCKDCGDQKRYVSCGRCVKCHNDKSRTRYASDPEERLRNIKVAKAWSKANRDRRLKTKKKWYQNNKEQHLDGVKEWQKKNPDKVKIIRAAKRRRREGAIGKYTPSDIRRIKSAQQDRCAYCRKRLKADYHVDHIQPLALGGTNWPYNIQLTCPKCNIDKSFKKPEVFAREIGLLL